MKIKLRHFAFCSTTGVVVTSSSTTRANEVLHPGQLTNGAAAMFCFLTWISSTFNVAPGPRLTLWFEFKPFSTVKTALFLYNLKSKTSETAACIKRFCYASNLLGKWPIRIFELKLTLCFFDSRTALRARNHLLSNIY